MAFGLGSKVRRTRHGSYKLLLEPDERELLKALPAQLRDLLASPEDPALRRLFPPAYLGEADMEAEYRRLMGDELMRSRAWALEVLESTAGADEVDEEQLGLWVNALNELRLVLGTQLDVSEGSEPDVDEDDPAFGTWLVYQYLTYLQGDLVEALADLL